MIRRIKIVVLTLVILVLSFFTIRTITNEVIIMLYDKGTYSNILIKNLYILNINEPYIAYYNNGNINYQKKEYDKAIDNYNKALKNNPPEKKVCKIRINTSLAIINNIKVTDKELVLEELKKARSYLYENDCAHEQDDNGKSKDAEQLEEEIKELERQVEEGKEINNNSNSQNNSNSNQTNYENVEEQLREKQKQNNTTRSEETSQAENMGDYEYYRGKRW